MSCETTEFRTARKYPPYIELGQCGPNAHLEDGVHVLPPIGATVAIPISADVREGTATGQGFGTLDLPDESDVAEGVEYDNATKTGTLVPEGDGGSFLSANTARVDPSGDDETGTVGDLSKPFATLQATCDALVDAGASAESVIYIPQDANSIGFVSTSLKHLTLIGPGQWGESIQGIEFTEPTENVFANFVNIYIGTVQSHTAAKLTVGLTSSELGDISNDAGKITLAADVSVSQVRNVTSDGDIYAWGLGNAGTFSAPGHEIHLVNISPIYDDGNGVPSGPTINSEESEVWATNATLQDVTCGALHLIDSRVIGTNNAESTVYADVLLKASEFDFSTLPTEDPEIDGRMWNNMGAPIISAGPPM